MALNVSLSLPCSAKYQIITPSSDPSRAASYPKTVVSFFTTTSTTTSTTSCSSSSISVSLLNNKKKSSNNSSSRRKGYGGGSVRSSLDTAGPTVRVGQVTEVNKDTFWPLVNAAGDKTVVLDMYTQWCGPCKVMAPKYQELSEKYLDVVFLKLDCNQENKPLAKELGIRVVPTFKILKDNKIVKEVTGAKFDDLVLAIDTVRSS